MTCTWVDCPNEATKPQIGERGQWANLCDQHDAELQDAIANFDARKLLSRWVKASGGAKKMAESI